MLPEVNYFNLKRVILKSDIGISHMHRHKYPVTLMYVLVVRWHTN